MSNVSEKKSQQIEFIKSLPFTAGEVIKLDEGLAEGYKKRAPTCDAPGDSYIPLHNRINGLATRAFQIR